MLAPIAVAALSARMLAEAGRDGGYRTVALDLFGDADTRRAAQAWFPLGDPATLSIDGEALLAALRRLRACGAAGWVAGSGFEAQPELLAAGAQVLPLIGNPPDVVARVRNPAGFFGRLAELGIPHPETRRDCPPSPLGWLRKDFASSGGRGVRPALRERLDASGTVGANSGPQAGIHYQRITPGAPMSALFVADGPAQPADRCQSADRAEIPRSSLCLLRLHRRAAAVVRRAAHARRLARCARG